MKVYISLTKSIYVYKTPPHSCNISLMSCLFILPQLQNLIVRFFRVTSLQPNLRNTLNPTREDDSSVRYLPNLIVVFYVAYKAITRWKIRLSMVVSTIAWLDVMGLHLFPCSYSSSESQFIFVDDVMITSISSLPYYLYP